MFNRLPKIEDQVLLMAIARLNNNTDFRMFRAYLDNAPALIAARMKSSKDDHELHWDQGAIQTIDDLEETFSNAYQWAQDIYNLGLKKVDAGI
jgi:hypothetical protein